MVRTVEDGVAYVDEARVGNTVMKSVLYQDWVNNGDLSLVGCGMGCSRFIGKLITVITVGGMARVLDRATIFCRCIVIGGLFYRYFL